MNSQATQETRTKQHNRVIIPLTPSHNTGPKTPEPAKTSRHLIYEHVKEALKSILDEALGMRFMNDQSGRETLENQHDQSIIINQ